MSSKNLSVAYTISGYPANWPFLISPKAKLFFFLFHIYYIYTFFFLEEIGGVNWPPYFSENMLEGGGSVTVGIHWLENNLRRIGDRFNFNLKLFYFLFSFLVNHQETSFSKWSAGAVKNFHFWNMRKMSPFWFFFDSFSSKFVGGTLSIYHILNGCTKIENIWDRGFSRGKKNGGGGMHFLVYSRRWKLIFYRSPFIALFCFPEKRKKKNNAPH